MSDLKAFHMGRSWTGHHLEDECPCPQEPCGRISYDKVDVDCPQHYYGRSKTMRNIHLAEDCERVMIEEKAAADKASEQL
jgi:ribosomal protein L37E